MENIEKIKKDLKQVLSERRYEHSIGVMNMAEEFAKIYKVDIETAKNADIEAIACSWGFRSFESLLAKSPSAIIDEPKYISKLF